VTGPAPVIELLRQRSRTTLFSNSLPPAVAASSLEAFRMLMEDPSPVQRLQKNALTFRTKMKAAGFRIPEGVHPIVPVLVGDTAKALAMSDALFARGVYVSGFGYPVVPQGHARLRCQISAVHTDADR
jgi:glycine C-acetyltransferase